MNLLEGCLAKIPSTNLVQVKTIIETRYLENIYTNFHKLSFDAKLSFYDGPINKEDLREIIEQTFFQSDYTPYTLGSEIHLFGVMPLKTMDLRSAEHLISKEPRYRGLIIKE